MTRLPDPRRYGGGGEADAVFSACGIAAAGDPGARQDCLAQLRRALHAGSDSAIWAMLRRAAAPEPYHALWDLICSATEEPVGQSPGAVVTRVFALPVIFIVAAREPLVIPGALPEIEAVRALLDRHGVLGATRNFGLSNALCPLEALENLPASTVYRWTAVSPAAAPRDIAAQKIRVARWPEQVHLRFLVGAGVSAADAPSLDETAGMISAWGMPLARELARQLAQPGLDLLAIPRPPAGLLRAVHSGRHAQVELAFHLFASNAVREFRSASGDPAVVLSAHRLDAGGAELRVSLSSELDDAALEGFRWPLHPLDDLAGIESSVLGYLDECRIGGACVVASVLPDRLENGSAFIAVRRVDAVARSLAAC